MIEKPLINILTRTSNRPNYFKKCFESVNSQIMVNINHIISVDNDETEEYVKKYTDNYIRVEHFNEYIPKLDPIYNVRKPAPYNLYLNELKNKVKEGWIMFLDDDDVFLDKCALFRITNKIENEEQMLYWKVKFSNDRIVPCEKSFKLKKPLINDFSMIGFMHHSKYNKCATFDYFSAGDSFYVIKLQNIIPNHTWLDIVCTGLQDNNGLGGRGLRNDLK